MVQDIRTRLIRIILIVVVIIGVIIGVIYFFTRNNDDESGTTPDTNQQDNTPVEEQLPPNPSQEIDFPEPTAQDEQPVTPPEDVEERYVRQLANIFVERFETRSSHNDNRHIDDVTTLVTPTMLSWIETQTQTQEVSYSGQTTQVISSDVTSYSDIEAIVEIGAQQQRQTTSGQETKQLFGRVELIKINGEWLVDGFFWD